MESSEAAELAAALAPRLALLEAIAVERHVTRAAERLDMPQPTVSRWLAGLSETLGAPVVVRHGRGIRLTRVGEVLAQASERAMSALEAGCRAALEEADPERGQVAFTFLHSTGAHEVPELLRKFRASHPTVRFNLAQGSHETMLRRIHAGEMDLALTAPVPVEEPGLESTVLYEQPLVLTVPTKHRLATRKRARLEEVAEEQFVGMKHGYGLRQITDALCEHAGFAPTLAFEGEEVDTVRGLVGAGLGVAILPPARPKLPEVVELNLIPAAKRAIGLVWAADVPLAPAARTFREFAIKARPLALFAGRGSVEA
ncbi:LysR family transcriptional regulator [Tenggerimyces flavus]|uniref:LysR family transcriptional regulator n=1 Tax=Tenggerimyces flavus TaxID=1708749 RepID=A0ABV7Y4A6_9ACTN|nr:LysR family transcriptional regulator [Tenggerimyces flavus]MBM7790860.1 DNA-binding transcriptional LysR family regulator [Tenggerimyces flavus]